MNIKLGEGDVIVEIRPSAFRRGVSLVAIGAVAAILVSFAVGGQDMSLVWRGFIVLFGLGCLALGYRFFKATSVSLQLTKEELRDSTGRVLFRLDDIHRVDRGAFALKPSNGMSVFLKKPGIAAWEPGLWWRFGKRIGIGGATAPAQAKAIVETLTLLQAERENSGDGQID